jgi:transposase
MEAFSPAVRQRIIQLYQSGLDTEDVAQIMACSLAGARRIWQRYREEGAVAVRPHGGGHTPKLDDEHKKQVFSELVAQKPDAFCREIAEELAQRLGVVVCRQTVGRWLRELGLTRKKSRCMPPSSKGRTCDSSVRSGSRRSPHSVTAISPVSRSSMRVER